MLNLCPQEKHIFFLLSWAEKKKKICFLPQRETLYFQSCLLVVSFLEKIEQKKSVRAFKQKHKRPIENYLPILTCFYSSEHMCSYY